MSRLLQISLQIVQQDSLLHLQASRKLADLLFVRLQDRLRCRLKLKCFFLCFHQTFQLLQQVCVLAATRFQGFTVLARLSLWLIANMRKTMQRRIGAHMVHTFALCSLSCAVLMVSSAVATTASASSFAAFSSSSSDNKSPTACFS
jgi:hypothetical protein